MTGAAIVRALSGAGFAAAAACSFPAPEACALACGEQGACPGEFECQASTQLCVPRGMTLPCTSTAILPNDGTGGASSRDAGAGASGAAAGGAAGTGGSSGSEGGAGPAGGAGTTNAGALAVARVSSSPESACTGAELRGTLRASGGLPPYAWRLVEAPPGTEPPAAEGDELELFGVPSEAGRIVVELRDSTGTSARFDALVVHERPEIALERLPPICAGEHYEVALAATGGDPDEYVWSAALLPGGGVPGTLAEIGLGVEDSTLSGDLLASGERAPFRVALAVHDGHCRSSDAELELDVVPSASDACPTIGIVDPPVVDALPAPCLGNFYAEALSVEGGEPPYRWEVVSEPPGLAFDEESATLDGIAEGDGVLAVAVIDQSSRVVRKSYDVVTRDSCWLGYVAAGPPARVELVDGRLLERQPELARRTLPSASGSDAVVDFRFSPDGRFIAYRLGADPGALRLELARVSDGQAQAVDLSGGVDAYAWSPDASTLAVAYGAGGQSFLGGVDVSAVDASALAPGESLGDLRQLQPRAVPRVDSTLAWYATDRLAFLSREPSAARRGLASVLLARAGFGAPSSRTDTDFSLSAEVIAGVGGVFVAEPETGLHTFYADGAERATPHAEPIVLSASGAFAGLGRGGALQIYRPARPSDPGEPPSFAANGCTTLLAWASERERIACADERGAGDAIALFEVPSAAGGSLAELGNLADVVVGPSGAHAGRRRAFSSSGRWFAFTSAEGLHVARVEPPAPHITLTLPISLLGVAPSVLAFSPDDSLLVVGAANSLGLVDLEQGAPSFRVLSPSALFDDFCSERFVDGASRWCGGASRAPELAWSSGSDLVAFRSSLGTLQLIDLSLAREGHVGAPLSPDTDCFEACSSSGSASFQP